MFFRELYPWLSDDWKPLSRALVQDRLPHALLLEGAPGLGRLALGRRLAGLALCSAPPTDSPGACGSCRTCKLLRAGNHPDYRELRIPEKKTRIPIDDVRELIRALQLQSHAGGRKIGLIAPAESLSIGAANALLKTLEEPPGDCLIILIAARAAALPATVRSRCQRHRVAAPSTSEALAWLRTTDPEHDWDEPLAAAGGAPLRARALAGDDFADLTRSLSRELAALAVGAGEPLATAGQWATRDAVASLSWLNELVESLIRGRMLGEKVVTVHSNSPESLQKYVRNINLPTLFDYLDRVRFAPVLLERQANARLVFETLLIPWTQGLRSENPNE